ncbi:unnamed protein product [Allacma fusca]|uniref:Uncharacterized protein n=1 Tax=Allacma fusca TaxID=39272 RepID=A0A8J2KAH7_9HEXA|nr:unnamed protein product [Allacma fusca]
MATTSRVNSVKDFKSEQAKSEIKREEARILQLLRKTQKDSGINKLSSKKLREKARSAAFYAHLHRMTRPSVFQKPSEPAPVTESGTGVLCVSPDLSSSIRVDCTTITEIVLDARIHIKTQDVGGMKVVWLQVREAVIGMCMSLRLMCPGTLKKPLYCISLCLGEAKAKQAWLAIALRFNLSSSSPLSALRYLRAFRGHSTTLHLRWEC